MPPNSGRHRTLRLGDAAPEPLDAYRAEQLDIETLMAFAVTTDHDRQRAVWERVSSRRAVPPGPLSHPRASHAGRSPRVRVASPASSTR